jgi:hypothetical protein
MNLTRAGDKRNRLAPGALEQVDEGRERTALGYQVK